MVRSLPGSSKPHQQVRQSLAQAVHLATDVLHGASKGHIWPPDSSTSVPGRRIHGILLGNRPRQNRLPKVGRGKISSIRADNSKRLALRSTGLPLRAGLNTTNSGRFGGAPTGAQMLHWHREAESEMVRQRLTTAQVRPYMAHWRAARAAEIRELRAATPEHKLRQMAALMLSVNVLGRSPGGDSEMAAARERWNRIRRAYALRT